jgi:hypothetical protein
MRSLLITIAAAATMLALAAPARAQDAPADSTAAPPIGPQKGAWSLSFVAPGYAGGETLEFGVWEMVGARTNLGVTLEVLVGGREEAVNGREGTAATTRAGLGLNARRYLASARRVTPYLQGRVFVRGAYQRNESPGVEDWHRGAQAGVEAALGAEWFPVHHFSVSGHTGVRLAASRFTQELTASDGQTLPLSTTEGSFQTFTSALAVRIYF